MGVGANGFRSQAAAGGAERHGEQRQRWDSRPDLVLRTRIFEVADVHGNDLVSGSSLCTQHDRKEHTRVCI